MNYSQALKVLGLKGSPSASAIKKAYFALSKKWHPDINKSSDAESKFKDLNLANTILKRGPGTELSFKDIRKEYGELRAQMKVVRSSLEEEISKKRAELKGLKDGSFTKKYALEKLASLENELDERKILNSAEIDLLQQNRNEDTKGVKLEVAKKLLVNEFDARDYIRGKARSRVLNRARYNLEPPEVQQAIYMQKMLKSLEFQEGLDIAKSNISGAFSSLKDGLVIKKNKAHVPLVSKVKGKFVIKLVVATVSLVSLILAGKYVYDQRYQAFKPVALLGDRK